MTSVELYPAVILTEQQAQQSFIKGDYSQAAEYYEQAIETEPEVKSHYWNLGLILLLQGQEAEAQVTWMMGMADGEAQQVEQWTVELLKILQSEAERREQLAEYTVAWAIRQHIREIAPQELNNLFHLIELAIKLETFTGDELKNFGVIELIQSESIVDFELLLQVLRGILYTTPLHPSVLEFVEATLPHIDDLNTFMRILIPAAVKVAHSMSQPKIAARFMELGLRLDPSNIEILRALGVFYIRSGNYSKGIETARLYDKLSPTLADRVSAKYLLLQGLMDIAESWQEAYKVLLEQESLLTSLVQEQLIDIEPIKVVRLFNSNYFAPYLRDDPKKNRQTQNQLAQFCQMNVEKYALEKFQQYKQRSLGKRTKLLKIGYLSHCLSNHSVGWLARWIFRHHDRDRFQIHAYFINYKQVFDPVQEWYLQNVTQAYKGGICTDEIAEQIYKDEIDVLIDLDSITLDIACEIMALKPAPVQATWLGWDASGIPAVDYFIADPYVLPESAQEYYKEKIWRLPHTYIAVDGFEVGVPTLRRDTLDIPSDAVIYLSAQRGFKRHPDTARLQMKIIKEVPNSYFLIKGLGDADAIQKFFMRVAEEEGVASDRLRFLPLDPSEATHRANLAIADVVLDTYPYNGATTTLETLWMGIPIVTKVGQQFAARNSYTMMMNAGITEGIAWNDEEYLEWGVRLGKDAALRQQISIQLRQSRQTSPLWNAKQFTREMEKAYEGMWQNHL
ncbi:O-linked N-acetylglucosamine transferase, SPINDLY family protein [Aetokthonos hydrillicola Thurmond2011]|jgi:predicted O-linked N-acetylglucosamine transferase (SPINDLY family)|uniref:protein O-GlcNAc transferase n=1 Tax=Aetokthonos hydrillicola Thurmond2011 TaxID=2712845 RepID=A0AAP5I953_9CYAN|nr:tetratricopeptide repeat protein [Aetokthonos hydrillicola]MBO3457777.1 O-linked N-acetylglucosamine transferase, SPINDLY family protein [Aetokthonos hydrillicola CCALA 1050]MBW4589372.1 O-linked N-acetylglucosamine transferase, SPINDLY family protein [Aetokthonos hydrillicola CCALA 1050]MDR9897151.1 O-linked N-acetylglucosamine transferase, SPINDLY family protein [Aetokthonos hydrillicola Thurmond2011]